MVRAGKTFGLILLGVMVASSGWMPARGATQFSTLDILPDDAAGPAPEAVETGRIRPLGKPVKVESIPIQSGNPLWSVPLSALTATRDRPIFSASRRPPPRAVAAVPVAPVVSPPPPPAAPEHPSLALVGAVVGENDAIAVFLDTANQGMVRLRKGEDHAGWVLNSVMPREVVLKKGEQTESLVLQRQDGQPGYSGGGGVPGVPGVPGVAPVAVPPPVVPGLVPGVGPNMVPGVGRGVPGVSPPPPPATRSNTYAPFVPRSTPKNGEPDGL